ncbi:hypothetical protein DJ64_33390 [Streptomyces griseorubens]|uniref:Secreted protein n=1 Tax=Streptomyces griseorubens TaxID=66897 RepID=A0ABR4T420_9ACTN|nr:hypothetical protein DJ64_33390 [Streptomyces griseorubens]
MSRLVFSGDGVVPACCGSAGSSPCGVVASPSGEGEGRNSLAKSLAIFGEVMVPSVRTLGRVFCGLGSSAFLLSISPSSDTP